MEKLNNKEVANVVEKVLNYGNLCKAKDISLRINFNNLSHTKWEELKNKIKNYLTKANISYELTDGTTLKQIRIPMQDYSRDMVITLYEKWR